MTTALPPIGRNGIVGLVRKLSGNVITGYRDVNPTAEFVAGQVAKLIESGDQVLVDVCTETATDKPVGIFFTHKTLSFYKPVVDEVQTFGDTANGNTATTITLNKPNLKGSAGTYVKVTNEAGGTVYTYTTDYTVNYTNGIVTRNGAGGIGATDTVKITYYYQDPEQAGVDMTIGSGKVALMEDKGEVASRVYDTAATWSLSGDDAIVVVGSDGVPTNKTVEGTAPVIGTVTKVPTAGDVELHFKLSI